MKDLKKDTDGYYMIIDDENGNEIEIRFNDNDTVTIIHESEETTISQAKLLQIIRNIRIANKLHSNESVLVEVGDVLIAKADAHMEYETYEDDMSPPQFLTAGKEYPVTDVDDRYVTIIDDEDDAHLFDADGLAEFFTVKTT